jgi:carbonic anhydrase
MSATLRLFLCAAALTPFLHLASCERDSAKRQATPAGEKAPKREAYTMPGLNHGLVQSPVNILTNQAEGGRHEVAINLHDADPEYLENKGHTIELDFPQGSSIAFDDREYQLKQLHFHTPSEHQIDGVTYPMEMHVVNMIEPEGADEPPLYLVMSFLFRMGEEDPFIETFLDQVPDEEGSRGPSTSRLEAGTSTSSITTTVALSRRGRTRRPSNG